MNTPTTGFTALRILMLSNTSTAAAKTAAVIAKAKLGHSSELLYSNTKRPGLFTTYCILIYQFFRLSSFFIAAKIKSWIDR